MALHIVGLFWHYSRSLLTGCRKSSLYIYMCYYIILHIYTYTCIYTYTYILSIYMCYYIILHIYTYTCIYTYTYITYTHDAENPLHATSSKTASEEEDTCVHIHIHTTQKILCTYTYMHTCIVNDVTYVTHELVCGPCPRPCVSYKYRKWYNICIYML